jgi:hypothetical protein
MDKGNNAWNKDASNKGSQNNTNKQNSANINKGSHTGRQDFSSRSGESRYDATHREQGKDLNKGQYDQRNISRDAQRNTHLNTGKNEKDTSKNISHDKRKAG